MNTKGCAHEQQAVFTSLFLLLLLLLEPKDDITSRQVHLYMQSMCYRFQLLTCLKLVGNGMLLKSDACKVMGKCDFRALAVHVYAQSSCRKRRRCFNCYFLPAQGKKWGGPGGPKPQETYGYLLKGCFTPAVMECRKWKSCICSIKVHFMIT